MGIIDSWPLIGVHILSYCMKMYEDKRPNLVSLLGPTILFGVPSRLGLRTGIVLGH